MRVLHVVGARPNFMKAAPIVRTMERFPKEFEQLLVHTGQHYDEAMSDSFFRDLGLPAPDVHLGVGSGSHAEQAARVLLALEPVLLDWKPDLLIVVGDVNSTVAAALTAVKLGIAVAHVEAGLRSFDRTMPEEINRILTDQIADLLFTTEESANENLRREGIPAERVRFVGNVMIDSLVAALESAKRSRIRERLNLGEVPYAVVTLHRPSNVDEPGALGGILAALETIAERCPVVFPVHPRTRDRIATAGLASRSNGLRLIDPLGYVDFLALYSGACLVLTDSGGLQEETTFLGIQCLTLRKNTERPVTLTLGTNRLVEPRRDEIERAAAEAFERRSKAGNRPPLWDGHAAERIVEQLRGLDRFAH